MSLSNHRHFRALNIFIILLELLVAQSVARPLGIHKSLRSTPTSGSFYREDLVLQIFLWPFFFIRCFKKNNCQLMVKECTLSTGKLPPGSLPRNSAVYCGCKATKQFIIIGLLKRYGPRVG